MNPTDREKSGATPRCSYDETYKRHAVELTMQRDPKVKAVAKELGLPAWQLYDWRKQYALKAAGLGPEPERLEDAQKEIMRLRAEVVRMREREVVQRRIPWAYSEASESGMPRSRR